MLVLLQSATVLRPSAKWDDMKRGLARNAGTTQLASLKALTSRLLRGGRGFDPRKNNSFFPVRFLLHSLSSLPSLFLLLFFPGSFPVPFLLLFFPGSFRFLPCSFPDVAAARVGVRVPTSWEATPPSPRGSHGVAHLCALVRAQRGTPTEPAYMCRCQGRTKRHQQQ